MSREDWYFVLACAGMTLGGLLVAVIGLIGELDTMAIVAGY